MPYQNPSHPPARPTPPPRDNIDRCIIVKAKMIVWKKLTRKLHYSLVQSGFVRVMENLESHGILKFVFQARKVIEFWFGSWKVVDNENNCIKTRVSLLLERKQNRNSGDLRTNTGSWIPMRLYF